jgi:DNA ligase 1
MGEHLPCLLAREWDPEKVDPTGWWMSEKLDGVRAWWDGEKFLSRISNVFAAPSWFTERLPKVALDGELFWKRGAFNETSGIVRRKDPASADLWRNVRFMVFDMPEFEEPFEKRVYRIRTSSLGHYATPVLHELVESREHLELRLEELVADGAEGLMIRQPGSLYEYKRSKTLLKVKPWYTDEVRVVGVEPWRGVLRPGRETWMGALSCEMRDGTEVRVGTGFDDTQRLPPHDHWIGEIVTIKFREKSEYGVPRHPVFHGVAIDKEFP